jgi:hypothetical protein
MRKTLIIFLFGMILCAAEASAEDFYVIPVKQTSLSPKTYYLSIPGTAFVGDNGERDTIQGKIRAAPGKVGWFFAPVNLPDGAVMKEIVVYYDNTDLVGYLVYFYRYPRHGDYATLASLSCQPKIDPEIEQSAITTQFSVVDNINYSYSIQAYLGQTNYLHSVRIEYSVQEPAP